MKPSEAKEQLLRLAIDRLPPQDALRIRTALGEFLVEQRRERAAEAAAMSLMGAEVGAANTATACRLSVSRYIAKLRGNAGLSGKSDTSPMYGSSRSRRVLTVIA